MHAQHNSNSLLIPHYFDKISTIISFTQKKKRLRQTSSRKRVKFNKAKKRRIHHSHWKNMIFIRFMSTLTALDFSIEYFFSLLNRVWPLKPSISINIFDWISWREWAREIHHSNINQDVLITDNFTFFPLFFQFVRISIKCYAYCERNWSSSSSRKHFFLLFNLKSSYWYAK